MLLKGYVWLSSFLVAQATLPCVSSDILLLSLKRSTLSQDKMGVMHLIDWWCNF